MQKGFAMKHDLKKTVKQFRLSGNLTENCHLGAGHINDTFLVTLDQGDSRVRYVLQRINHHIFQDPPALMNNVIRVTDHIRSKMVAEHPALAARQLQVIRTVDNQGYYQCPDGHYWRMYNMIEDTVTYDVMINPEIAFEAAHMFGNFQKMLSELPGGALNETIPDFHNTPKRLQAFLEILDEDPCNRAFQVKNEIAFVLKHAPICSVLLNLLKDSSPHYA
jgi:hypothetical protein